MEGLRVTSEVNVAVEELRATFDQCTIDWTEDGNGGAFVTIRDVGLTPDIYEQQSSWLGFHITHTYPYADVYPHFVRHDLSRKDKKPLGEGISIGNFRECPAIQLSRKSNKHNPATDTAAIKAQKVLLWLNSR